MSKLIYCATPSRLAYKTDEIMDFITRQGDAPLHPFKAFPFERFEGNPQVGRQKSLEYCLRLINISDEFALFGVSEGTLTELLYTQTIIKPVRFHLEFDPKWREFYEKLRQNYRNLLEKLIK